MPSEYSGQQPILLAVGKNLKTSMIFENMGIVPLEMKHRRNIMGHSITELTDWLQEIKGSTVFIKKEELSTGLNEVMDTDEVKLSLEGVTLRESMDEHIDDYLENQELILQGTGSIKSDNGEAQIPNDMYEIPLAGAVSVTKEGDSIKVETEKAAYTFKV